jgi:hypothetical protein
VCLLKKSKEEEELAVTIDHMPHSTALHTSAAIWKTFLLYATRIFVGRKRDTLK